MKLKIQLNNSTNKGLQITLKISVALINSKKSHLSSYLCFSFFSLHVPCVFSQACQSIYPSLWIFASFYKHELSLKCVTGSAFCLLVYLHQSHHRDGLHPARRSIENWFAEIFFLKIPSGRSVYSFCANVLQSKCAYGSPGLACCFWYQFLMHLIWCWFFCSFISQRVRHSGWIHIFDLAQIFTSSWRGSCTYYTIITLMLWFQKLYASILFLFFLS